MRGFGAVLIGLVTVAAAVGSGVIGFWVALSIAFAEDENWPPGSVVAFLGFLVLALAILVAGFRAVRRIAGEPGPSRLSPPPPPPPLPPPPPPAP
jgi:hypothetical protein